jgi:hypothetical protein
MYVEPSIGAAPDLFDTAEDDVQMDVVSPKRSVATDLTTISSDL